MTLETLETITWTLAVLFFAGGAWAVSRAIFELRQVSKWDTFQEQLRDWEEEQR